MVCLSQDNWDPADSNKPKVDAAIYPRRKHPGDGRPHWDEDDSVAKRSWLAAVRRFLLSHTSGWEGILWHKTDKRNPREWFSTQVIPEDADEEAGPRLSNLEHELLWAWFLRRTQLGRGPLKLLPQPKGAQGNRWVCKLCREQSEASAPVESAA